jgi:hypothetical protein
MCPAVCTKMYTMLDSRMGAMQKEVRGLSQRLDATQMNWQRSQFPRAPRVPGPRGRAAAATTSSENLSMRLAALRFPAPPKVPASYARKQNTAALKTWKNVDARFTQVAGGPRARRALSHWRLRHEQGETSRKRKRNTRNTRNTRNNSSNSNNSSNNNGNHGVKVPTRARRSLRLTAPMGV